MNKNLKNRKKNPRLSVVNPKATRQPLAAGNSAGMQSGAASGIVATGLSTTFTADSTPAGYNTATSSTRGLVVNKPGKELEVSKRSAELTRTDPSTAKPTDRCLAKRILTRNATAPVTREQASAEDYAKIQLEMGWAKAVMPDFQLEDPPSDGEIPSDIVLAKRILTRNATAPVTREQVSAEDYANTEQDLAWAKAFMPDFQLEEPPSDRNLPSDRVLARRILTRNANAPTTREQASAEDFAEDFANVQQDLAWAMGVMPDFQLEEPQSFAEKRTRCKQKPESKAPKRARTQASIPASFADLTRGKVLIGVIDVNNPGGRIPRHQWRWVQLALTPIAIQMWRENPGPPASCEDAGWFQGTVKLIACGDERSAQLYKVAVKKLGEVYPGANLTVVDAKDIPSQPRARAILPSCPVDPAEILEAIRLFNPGMPRTSWRVLKIERSNHASMQVLFQIDNESSAYLATTGGQINYGFSKAFVKVYKSVPGALANPATSGLTADSVDSLSEDEDELKIKSPEEDQQKGNDSSDSDFGEAFCRSYAEKQLIAKAKMEADRIERLNASAAAAQDQSAAQHRCAAAAAAPGNRTF